MNMGYKVQRARFYSAFVLIRGGNANNGANDGPLYGNWNNTASNSNWNYGARPTLLMLECMKYQRLIALALAKNNSRLPSGRLGTRISRFFLEYPRRQERKEYRSMPHRVGFLFDRMIAHDNCVQAEINLGKNKPDNRMAKHIAAHPQKYADALCEKLSTGTFVFHESHETEITDSYKGKTRHLKIPCLEDQAAQQAWLNIAIPYIERRNYYYNCGSIPKAGQSRACNALKRWLKRKPKYGAITDISKFYDNIPHWVVKRGLERIFKDKRFIDFAMQIMASMSSTGVGLAIGHPTSHWFANIALMEIDHELRRLFPDVRFVRYMDDMGFTTNNKRHLWKALKHLIQRLASFRLKLKRTFSVFRIKGRGLQFLSYRFFYGYTILAKQLMYRIARKMKRAAARLTLHNAQGVISYIGILKHCDSYHFRQAHVYPYVNPKKCRRLISNASKNNVCKQAG